MICLVIDGKNNFLVLPGAKCRSDWVITNGPTDPNCYVISGSASGYDICCPTEHECHRNGNLNNNGNTPAGPICRPGYRGSSTPNNQCYKLCRRTIDYSHCCLVDSSSQEEGRQISNLTIRFAQFKSSKVGNETVTDATSGVCRQEYHLSSQSNYTCCYEHQTGGGHRYCCPSQVKAFEENCLPTIIKTTRCPSDWARSFKFYDSRCYLFKISGHGDDYCCPISSRSAKLCWRVGFIPSNTPYSVRCYPYNYRYCCPLSRQW